MDISEKHGSHTATLKTVKLFNTLNHFGWLQYHVSSYKTSQRGACLLGSATVEVRSFGQNLWLESWDELNAVVYQWRKTGGIQVRATRGLSQRDECQMDLVVGGGGVLTRGNHTGPKVVVWVGHDTCSSKCPFIRWWSCPLCFIAAVCMQNAVRWGSYGQ